MRTVTIQLRDETFAAVERTAAERGIPVDEVLRAAIEHGTLALETSVESAIDRVLTKNAELYRRLS